MLQPSITISLLPSQPQMPFVLGPNLADAIATAAKLGFPAIELFPPNLEAIDVEHIRQVAQQYQIRVSTIGTGGGWVTEKLSLTDPAIEVRERAKAYIRGVIEKAADLGAAAIIGSMQGRCGMQDRATCLAALKRDLNELAQFATALHQPLFFEPLNRYETDLFHSVISAADFLADGGHDNLRLLADLFHMNIEEVNIADALLRVKDRLGHIHFVDSNRQSPGRGHTDFAPIVAALKSINFSGFLAIEAFPLPDQERAAASAIRAFRDWFGS